MPPARNKKARRQANCATLSSSTSDTTVANFRQQCAEKGLPTQGRRNVLIARLQNHAARNANSASRPPVETTALLTEEQLAQIQSIVTKTVEQSVSEIALNAAQPRTQALFLKENIILNSVLYI